MSDFRKVLDNEADCSEVDGPNEQAKLLVALDALYGDRLATLASRDARIRAEGAKWAISAMADYFREAQAFKVSAHIETLAKAIDDGTVDIRCD